MWEYAFLAPCFPMENLLPWRISSHSAPYCFCEPQQSCLAPLRWQCCQHHSNTCIITHHACPICQSQSGKLTFWHVRVCIPASPLNLVGTSQHSYWVICEELWVRIRLWKKTGMGQRSNHAGVLCLIFRLQVSGNYKKHLG